MLQTLQYFLTMKSSGDHDAEDAKNGVYLSLTERVRYWTDGGIIAIEKDLREDACQIYGTENGAKHRFKKLISDEFRDLKLYSLRCLRSIA